MGEENKELEPGKKRSLCKTELGKIKRKFRMQKRNHS